MAWPISLPSAVRYIQTLILLRVAAARGAAFNTRIPGHNWASEYIHLFAISVTERLAAASDTEYVDGVGYSPDGSDNRILWIGACPIAP